MKRPLLLWPEPPVYAVETEPATDIVPGRCARCSLSTGVKTVAMQPEGEGGGLFVVGMYPGREEDLRGRPNVGESGAYLRKLLARWWSGPVAMDNALRCAPGQRAVTEKQVSACRTYLAAVLREVKPTRVVTLGEVAALGVLGRGVSTQGIRRAHAWLGGKTPVVMLTHPVNALRNRFVRGAFESDFQWALETAFVPPAWGSMVCWEVDDDDDLASEALAAMRETRTAWDVEAAGEMYGPSYRVLCLSATPAGSDETFVFTAKSLAHPGIRADLVAWLSDPDYERVAQNGKYDAQAVACALGAWPGPDVLDTRLVRKLLEPESPAYLEDMADLVGLGGHKDAIARAKEDAVAHVRRRLAADRKAAKTRTLSMSFMHDDPLHPALEKDPGLDAFVRRCESAGDEPERWVYALVPRRSLHVYNARDALVTGRLAGAMKADLAGEPDLERTWSTLVGPASTAIARVEAWGVAADLDAIEAFDDYLALESRGYAERLEVLAPGMNWGSNKQVSELLYGKLGLPVHHKTDSGAPSVDEAALESLRLLHDIPALLVELRSTETLRKYGGRGLGLHVRPDGRIHCSYNVDGSRSGRISSSDPNLQNIPSEKTDPVRGRMARDVFVARPGYTLCAADYSQLELRVAAALSGDENMKAVFSSGVDFHKKTAMLIAPVAWGIRPEQVTDAHRRYAKTIVFGKAYGMGTHTLAGRLGCSKAEAERVETAIMGTFKRYSAWCEERVREARTTGVTHTYDPHNPARRARRRPLWRIADPDSERRSRAEHGSFNTPVQGTASDYCLLSLVEIVDWLVTDRVPACLVLTVHDQLVCEARNDVADEVASAMVSIMESRKCDVPLTVDLEMGDRWGSLGKVKKGA
jgi:uracil-DNA glycosylase family 4